MFAYPYPQAETVYLEVTISDFKHHAYGRRQT